MNWRVLCFSALQQRFFDETDSYEYDTHSEATNYPTDDGVQEQATAGIAAGRASTVPPHSTPDDTTHVTSPQCPAGTSDCTAKDYPDCSSP